MRIVSIIMAAAVPALAAGVSAAQQTVAVATPTANMAVFPAPHFFVALISGVLLALAFQLLLTNLSAGLGITAAGMTRSPESRREPEPGTPGRTRQGLFPAARKTVTGLGLWALITASLSLFFASWLGVELALVASGAIGAILGLVIWALFYGVMTAAEGYAATSLVGGILSAAKSGLRAAREGAGAVFGKSEEEKAADTAAQVTAAVRKEVFGDIGGDDLRSQLQAAVDKLSPASFDATRMRQELQKLFSETEIHAISAGEGPLLEQEKVIAALKMKGGMSSEQQKTIAHGLQSALEAIRQEKGAPKPAAEKAADAAMRAAGLSGEEAKQYRSRFESMLRSTGKQELNPDNLKRDIERLVHEPGAAKEIVQSRLAVLDKPTVAKVLAQRSDMSEQEARQAVDKVDMIIQQIRIRFGGGGGGGEAGRGAAPALESARESARRKVENYLNSLGRPELRYEGIEQDIRQLFSHPREGAEALLARLKSLDRESIKAVISSKKDMSPDDAERLVSRVESMRDDALAKAERMKAEVERRLERARLEALDKVEETRKTVATAAWWALATAAGSGLASALGGMVAVLT